MEMSEVSSTPNPLAQEVRTRLVKNALGGVNLLDAAIDAFLTTQRDAVATLKVMQARRDDWDAYQRHRKAWLASVERVWLMALSAGVPEKLSDTDFEALTLVGDDVVENRIIASRVSQWIGEKVGAEFEDLRVRMHEIDGRDLSSLDVLRHAKLISLMIDEWLEVGLERALLQSINEVFRQKLLDCFQTTYRNLNAFLIEKGVMPQIDARARMRSKASTSKKKASSVDTVASASALVPTSSSGPLMDAVPADGSAQSISQPQGLGYGGGMPVGAAYSGPRIAISHSMGNESTKVLTPFDHQQAQSQSILNQLRRFISIPVAGQSGAAMGVAGQAMPMAGGSNPALAASNVANGSMMYGGGIGANYPVAQGEYRAGAQQQVSGTSATVGAVAGGLSGPMISSALAQALLPQANSGPPGIFLQETFHSEDLVKALQVVRERAGDLKAKAETVNEKATIEVVALMFQSILAEDRIPAGIRIWFSRLQVPVLRVALSEPEFFNTQDHPARLLMDRMGSCVMGFDPAVLSGGALEGEIRRIVQVLEQYPETGRRVFELVYKEFEKFLSKFLTTKEETARVVGVAQQIEQRETLTIQFTIELRKMLKDIAVRDEIREFLFKVWAEVLAVMSMRVGVKHAQTLACKQTAVDLIWSSSAKPNRADRARMVKSLPRLLQQLRQGLEVLKITGTEQDAQIKTINAILDAAFSARTEAIPQARIDALSQQLANLEDFLSDDDMVEFPLDEESIEMVLGIDAASIAVLPDGNAKPSKEALNWAASIALASWSTIDHNGTARQVQYVWRSERGLLHYFAAMDGFGYLIQKQRMAAYLEAALLVPKIEEAITLRATRNALAKLEANPERLLA